MRSKYWNRREGRLTKMVLLAFSAVLLMLSSTGGAAGAAPAPRSELAKPAEAALLPTCQPHRYWITEFQMIWGPSASIPPCSYVNIVAYRASATDTGWIPWCYSLGGNPVITNPEDVAICYGWYVPQAGYTPAGIPFDSTIAISELQMVWGPVWFLPPNNFVKIMAYKASGSDAGWIFWCAQFNVVSYDDTGNIGSCTVYWT